MASLTGIQQTARAPEPRGRFAALRSRNFRLMALGFFSANAGWWMLFTAQSWLVLNLTDSAASLGMTGALVYLPSVFLGIAGGVLADRYPKRRILISYFSGWAAVSVILAVLTLTGTVRLWHVQLLLAGIGVVMALGFPSFHPLVAETVAPESLRGAISLTFSVAQLAALLGPAIAGLLITTVGPGGTLIAAAACYAVPLISMTRVRTAELRSLPPLALRRGGLRDGIQYALGRADVFWPTVLIGLFGMFTINLPITLAVYARSVFESGPGGYGLLTTVVAVGALLGALISAGQSRTRLRTLALFGGILSVLYMVSSAAPNQIVFCILLLGVGTFTLLLQSSCNSTVLMAAHGGIRGRVMSLYMTVWFLGIAIGGPVLGAIDQYLGPQAGMLLAGVLPGAATVLVSMRLAFRLRSMRRPSADVQCAPGHRPRGGADQAAGDAPVGPSLVTFPWMGLHVEPSGTSEM
ncbi:MFS transporter [Paenarthrobacter sp. NPDC058233]